MKNLPLKYEEIMLRRGFVPVVVIVAFALLAIFGGTTIVAWRTTLLDFYLPQTVKEFLGKEKSDSDTAPVISDTSEPSLQDSETTAEDPTKDWKTYTNAELGFSFKYPGDWKKNLVEADNEVVLLESKDGKAYMNFYNSGGAFGGEPGWETSNGIERKIYYTSDNFQVIVEIVYTGRNGEAVVSGNFNQQIQGLVFTYVFDNKLMPGGLDVLSLILSTFKFL